jgi:hypothetical protein
MGNGLSGSTQMVGLFQQLAASQSLSTQNLQELQTYVQQAQQNLYNDVTGKKDAAMASAYGELKANTNALHGLQYYLKRNTQLNKVQEDIAGTVQAQASAIEEDQNLAKRQNEINEWEAGNKRDTLFIYQMLLVSLSITIILAYLMRAGIMGEYLFYSLTLLLVLIVVFTIVNRAQYTNSIRDRRFWNKRRFPTDTKPLNTSLCLDLSSERGISLTDMSGNGIVSPMPSMDMSGNKLGANLKQSFNNIMGGMSL